MTSTTIINPQIDFSELKPAEIKMLDTTLLMTSYPEPPPRKKHLKINTDLDKNIKIVIDTQDQSHQKTISKKFKSFIKDFASSSSVKLKLGFNNLV